MNLLIVAFSNSEITLFVSSSVETYNAPPEDQSCKLSAVSKESYKNIGKSYFETVVFPTNFTAGTRTRLKAGFENPLAMLKLNTVTLRMPFSNHSKN